MKVCVIVDGYSGGVYLAPEFKRRGFSCVHVQSEAGIWEKVLPTFDATIFAESILFQGTLQTVLDALSKYEVLCVIPGTETGVELADKIAETLGVFPNGTSLSPARRDKFLMVEACRKKGLLVAEQIKSHDEQEIIDWYIRSRLNRVVIKPHHSAGTEDVFLCTQMEEVSNAIKHILSKKNILGLSNSEVVAQEYLEGTEYFVDTVSHQGTVLFTDIWKYKKRTINGRNFVYDCNYLCSPKEKTIQELMHYTKEVLEALGILFGPAHTEIIYTPKGPALVEIGARLDGLTLPSVNNKAIGYSAVEALVDCYIDKEAFLKKQASLYPNLNFARTVYLTSYRDGILLGFPGRTRIKELESFFQLTMRVKEGGVLKKTINYFTAPGFLTLIHKDPMVIEQDYQMIRRWESEDKLFTYLPEVAVEKGHDHSLPLTS